MAFLEQLSDEERTLVVSLPYRVGLWVSTVDNTGGRVSQAEEIASLERVVSHQMAGMFRSAFVHEVMAELVARKSEWPRWAEGTDSALGDCQKALAILKKHQAARDIDAYRENVMRIGSEVAATFRETDLSKPALSRVAAWLRISIDKVVGKVRGEVYESERLLRISYEEDLALSQLASTLKGETA